MFCCYVVANRLSCKHANGSQAGKLSPARITIRPMSADWDRLRRRNDGGTADAFKFFGVLSSH